MLSRAHALPVPQMAHVYGEASLVYKLVSMKNKIFLSEKLILQKIEEQSHTLTSFSRYVITIKLNNYLIYVSSILVALVVASDYVSILIIL